MKKHLFGCLTIIGLFSISTFAELKPFSVAVKGGIGLATLWGNNSQDSMGMVPAFRSGFYGGLSGAFQFSEFFAVQLECLYSMKGKSITGYYDSYTKDISYKLDYCELPITIRYSVPISPISDFFVFAGPNISYRISAIKDSSIYWIQSDAKMPDSSTNIQSQTNPFDFGITLGGGMAIDAGPGEILFDVRYTFGLVSIDKLTDAEKNKGAKQLDLKNSHVGFMLGYQIKF